MIGIVWILAGVILLGVYNALLLLDDKTPEGDASNLDLEEKWHVIGACLFIYIAATAWIFFGWQYAPFTLLCFWSIFAGIVHKVALNKPFFFVGTTAKTDQLFRKVFPNNTELWSGIIKITLLAASTILLFL